MTDLISLVESIPKIELHAHLNGCVRESTLHEIAKEHGINLSDHHFAQCSDNDDTVSQMYNSKPRSLLDCFEIFVQVGQVVSNLHVLERITLEALQDFAKHHVVYVELRSTPKRLFKSWGSDQLMSKLDYINIILSVIQDFESKEQQRYELERKTSGMANKCRLPLRARLLISIDRGRTIDEANENVNLAIDLHRGGNTYIVGIDLGGNPLRNDFRDFTDPLRKARQAGLKITLHCGEIACAQDHTDSNPVHVHALDEAKAVLDFHPDRLGHALLLPPSLRSTLAALRIPVETCPTSNVMTLELANSFHGNLVQGLKAHPQMEHWLNKDYPISINTDDPGVFNTTSSKELLLIILTWNLTPLQVKKIVLGSIDHAFCEDELKRLLRDCMIPYFDHFCQSQDVFPV